MTSFAAAFKILFYVIPAALAILFLRKLLNPQQRQTVHRAAVLAAWILPAFAILLALLRLWQNTGG